MNFDLCLLIYFIAFILSIHLTLSEDAENQNEEQNDIQNQAPNSEEKNQINEEKSQDVKQEDTKPEGEESTENKGNNIVTLPTTQSLTSNKLLLAELLSHQYYQYEKKHS